MKGRRRTGRRPSACSGPR